MVGLGYAFEEFTIGRLSNFFHCNNIQGKAVSVSKLSKLYKTNNLSDKVDREESTPCRYSTPYFAN